MAEDKKSFDGYLEKLALIADAVDVLHNGKKAIVFELKKDELQEVKKLINSKDENNQFKIDISGIEFIFLLNES